MSELSTKERILDAARRADAREEFSFRGTQRNFEGSERAKGVRFIIILKSKEQFGVEMLQHYVADATAYRKTNPFWRQMRSPIRCCVYFSYLEGNIAEVIENAGALSLV